MRSATRHRQGHRHGSPTSWSAPSEASIAALIARIVRNMPLHYVDPHKKHGLSYRAWESFGRSRLGQFLARHLFSRIDPWLSRATGGRYPWILGAPATAPLMTTGAKSGQRREHQITYFHDGPDPIVTASNYGGPKHPQWYYNLKAHPECELGGEEFLASEVTDPADYARVYALAEGVYQGWSDYRLSTDPMGRQIPVFRLGARPAPDPSRRVPESFAAEGDLPGLQTGA
jgi:deazaflavin-dependent oxidoreductase (nitroreductase family)